MRELCADVRELHRLPDNAGALFQVASQFNLLEMTSNRVTPAHGVTCYEDDLTQGPACAISCGAAAIYRNYFVYIDGHRGQSSTRQLDCLASFGKKLGNTDSALWRMENGYALPGMAGLVAINEKLERMNLAEREALKGALQIGVHYDTRVTLDGCGHTVSHALCSAMPVAYSGHPDKYWSLFATLILEAAYEATLLAGMINARRTGNHTVFLTQLGGGAFGNRTQWIVDAICAVLMRYQFCGLDIVLVSHGRSNGLVDSVLQRMTRGR